MKEKRLLNSKRILLALVLTLIIFSSIFIIGYLVSYSEYKGTSNSQEEMLFQIISFNIKQELLGDYCNNFNLQDLSEELDSFGSILGILEVRFGKDDSRILDQKQKYSILEAQHFIYIEKYKEKCNSNITTILFFYSNDEGFKDASEKTGFILSSLKSKNSKNLMIYSFDYNLDSEIISLLKKTYSVSSPNYLVVNKEIHLQDLQKIEQIEVLIG